MAIVGVKRAQSGFVGVHIIELEFLSANRLDTVHDLDKPAASRQTFVAEKQRSLPLRKDQVLRDELAVAHEMDFSRCGNLVQENVAADPVGAPCGRGKRLSLFDDFRDEKMLRHDEEIDDGK